MTPDELTPADGVDRVTDVPGVSVGHAEVPGGGSGCTVLLGPFRGRVDLRGLATGSREIETMTGDHVVPRVDALLFTGGSAFGLHSAQGVVDWLEAQGRGHSTSVGPVPIVPAVVLYDLGPGRRRPGPDEGRAACESASSDAVDEGRVGAGAGATVGKLLGIDRAHPGGVGSASRRCGRWTMGALAAVNAVGDIIERDGTIVAGSRGLDGFEDGSRAVLENPAAFGSEGESPVRAGENTTLAAVVTDAPLRGIDLVRMGRLASTALARRISPVHTPFDGDFTFALSTSEEERPHKPEEMLSMGLAAREALETAILRSVRPRDRRRS